MVDLLATLKGDQTITAKKPNTLLAEAEAFVDGLFDRELVVV